MFTISFISPESKSQVRASGVWERDRKARNYAKSLADKFREVTVWNGQPGELRVVTFNPLCDAERFGDSCSVCKP